MEINFYHSSSAIRKMFPPVPAKKFLPDWYKKLEAVLDNSDDSDFAPAKSATIKNCVPVQDMITSGYIIRTPVEYEVKAEQKEDIEVLKARCPEAFHIHGHYHHQFPVQTQGKCKSYLKITTGWRIETPPGYSCLITQPFYFMEERFTVLPAIVDTDSYDGYVEFPIYANTTEQFCISPGTPLVQIIPFRREEWNSSIQEDTEDSILQYFISKPLARVYKNYFHSKKTYK